MYESSVWGSVRTQHPNPILFTSILLLQLLSFLWGGESPLQSKSHASIYLSISSSGKLFLEYLLYEPLTYHGEHYCCPSLQLIHKIYSYVKMLGSDSSHSFVYCICFIYEYLPHLALWDVTKDTRAGFCSVGIHVLLWGDWQFRALSQCCPMEDRYVKTWCLIIGWCATLEVLRDSWTVVAESEVMKSAGYEKLQAETTANRRTRGGEGLRIFEDQKGNQCSWVLWASRQWSEEGIGRSLDCVQLF